MIKIVYFNVRARAETARMILEYGKIPYVDENTATYFGCGWREAKSQTPFGQLPLIDVGDGVVFAQEAAINRYCASLVPELVPADPRQAAVCDSIYFAAEELSAVNPIVNVKSGEEFARAKKDFLDNVLPRRLQNLKKFMAIFKTK